MKPTFAERLTFSWFIAQRYLMTHRLSRSLSFISVFTVVGIALGTGTLIIALSILDGFDKEIKEKVVGFTSHIQVESYQSKPIQQFGQVAEKIARTAPSVRSITPYVSQEAIIRSGEVIDGVILKGIVPAADRSIAKQLITAGRFLQPSSVQKEIVLGAGLARRLSLQVGDSTFIFAISGMEGFSSQPKGASFHVVGTYESGMSEYDDVFAYIGLDEAQQLYSMDSSITGFEILTASMEEIEPLADSISRSLGYPFYVRTVFQNYRNLFSWIDLQKEMSPVVLALLCIVAVINLVGTMLMMIIEKTSAIGVLRSIGATRSGISTVFLIQGMMLSALGIAIGNLLAFVLCWSQARFQYFSIPSEVYFMTKVPVLLSPENFALVSFVALALSFLMSLLPAIAASRLNIISALRFG